jgi:hypothetical protein
LVGPHEAKVVVGLGGVCRVKVDGAFKKLGRLVVKASLLGGRPVLEVEAVVHDLLSAGFTLVHGFFKSRDRRLALFCLAQCDAKHVSNLRSRRVMATCLLQDSHGTVIFPQTPDKQRREMKVVIRLGGVDKQTLFEVSHRLGILGLGFFRLVRLRKRLGILFQDTSQ